ncbi:hypothetical protein C9439_03715 [archaeon SCG-AAA382B04]|nr:hypothetical protein C9439_03715 [archaeon SCG-AAA382B04]
MSRYPITGPTRRLEEKINGQKKPKPQNLKDKPYTKTNIVLALVAERGAICLHKDKRDFQGQQVLNAIRERPEFKVDRDKALISLYNYLSRLKNQRYVKKIKVLKADGEYNKKTGAYGITKKGYQEANWLKNQRKLPPDLLDATFVDPSSRRFSDRRENILIRFTHQ